MTTTRREADICIVGAGLAGLTAARRLSQAGRSVVVLEARDRVGGRTMTVTGQSGVPIDMGGAFVGPNHDRLKGLSKEVGVEIFPTYVQGSYVLANGGKVRRYKGDIPRLNPVALASAGVAIARMNKMAKTIPVESPWKAKRAAEWDAQSVRHWLSPIHVPTQLARNLVEATVRACFCTELSEVSFLNWLYLVQASGGIEQLMSIKGGYQDSQFDGGVQAISLGMARDLGESVILESPVTTISQTNDAVEVASERATVRARRVVLALPRLLTTGIRFDPVLPLDHAQLIHQIPAGTELKMVAVYDEPFWRADGLNGATVATNDAIEVTLDTTQPGHAHGVMAGYCAGPHARRLSAASADERRSAFLTMLTTRLGPKAAHPLEIHEKNWAEDEWTRGCSMGHFGTGVLTQFGRRLREPVGRVHWAGTETATKSYGAMDGAVRSGERVTEEILALPA